MNKRSLLVTSMEAIHFQDGQLGAKMELVLDKLRSSEQTDKNKKKYFEELSEVIFTGLGIKVIFEENPNTLAAVYVPTIHIDHIFNEEIYKEYHKNDLKKMLRLAKTHKETSIVDLKNSFVSGVFSRLKNTIILNLGILFRKKDPITTPEVTSIILHELGHLFGCFEYATRTITTNQAIAIVSKSLMDKIPTTEYEFVLEQVGELVGKDKKLLKEFQTVTDSRLISTLIIDKSRDQAKSELNTGYYDYTTFEYISDQFAARHGYGRELILALDKVSKGAFSLDHSSRSHIFADISTITATIGAGLMVAGGIATINPIAIFVGSIILIGQIFGASYVNSDFTYDQLKVRYKRIREQEIEFLKSSHIDNASKEDAIKSLDQMKDLIDKMVIYEPIYQRIFSFFSKKNRDAKAAVQLQRDLEELASNELFVKAAQLSTLHK